MKIKNIYNLLFYVVSIIILTINCVKIPSEAPPLPELNARIRFIHTAADMGQGSVFVDGEEKTSLGFGEESSYFTIDAGNRVFQFQGESPETLFVDTDFSGSIYISNKIISEDRRFIKKRERWLYSQPLSNNLARIIIAQMSLDTLFVSLQGLDPWELSFASFQSATISRGSASISISTATAALDTITQIFNGGTSTTVVIMGSASDLKIKSYVNE